MTDNIDKPTEEIELHTNIGVEVSQNQKEVNKKIEDLRKQAAELRKTIPRKAKKQILPMALSDDEFKKVIDSLGKNPKKEIKISFLLAYESGLRVSEIKNLQKENIDIVGKRIFIKQGKYSKDRVVPLPKTWKGYMIELIPIKCSIRTLERQFKNSCKKAGLRSDLHFHNLRHSFATHCLERGMPINQVQILMGHSTVHTTNVYIRANPIDALATYERTF